MPVRIKTIHIVVMIAAIILGAGGWVWAFYELPEREVEHRYYEGSLYVNEAGSPKGDSNHTATYNASLTTVDGVGFLLLVYVSGDEDQLAQHMFNVSGLHEDEGVLALTLEGNSITLDWVAEDLVWDGNYSNHFIASWGPEADPEKDRGLIFAHYFPGLAEDYYVELRLQPP
jgi:hypothetical protein